MKVKLKHQLKDGRFVEIEGEPSDIAHTVHELDKGAPTELRNRMDFGPSQPTLTQILKKERKKVRRKEVVDYILAIDRPDMKHSMKDLMTHFFGEVLSSQDGISGYQSFYNMVIRAHGEIASKKGGAWDADWELDKDGRYREYKFVQK
jgi:hypothetical protein